MQRRQSQASDQSQVNILHDEHHIHNKTDIQNDKLDEDNDLSLESDKHASRVLITGRFIRNKDNEYELECQATVDGVPVVTHGARKPDSVSSQHHHYLKPEVQDHQIQTDLTKDDIISHDDFVYKICNQGLHPAELNLHILFKGNSKDSINYDGKKVPCVISTGKVKRTNSNKSNVTDRQMQTQKSSSTAKTKRSPEKVNRKSNANSKQSSPNLSPSRKSTREKVNRENSIQEKKMAKDKYTFNSLKPKIPSLKRKTEIQNKKVPSKTDPTKKEKSWKMKSPLRKTKKEPIKVSEREEIKVLYQNEIKTPNNSKINNSDTSTNKESRPRSYSTALNNPKTNNADTNDLEEVKVKKPLLGSVSKNSINGGARTAYSLRKLVTGSESKVLPDVKKSPKPSTSQLLAINLSGSSPKSKPVSRSPSRTPSPYDVKKSAMGSPKSSPQTASPPKLTTPSVLVSQYPCCEKCFQCINHVSDGEKSMTQSIAQSIKSSPKPLSQSVPPTSITKARHPCGGKCTKCTHSQSNEINHQQELHVSEKKSKVIKSPTPIRLRTESPKAAVSRSGSPRVALPGEVSKPTCGGKCTTCSKSVLGRDNQQQRNLHNKNSRDSNLSPVVKLTSETHSSSRSGSPPKITLLGESDRCVDQCIQCKNCPYNSNTKDNQLIADRSSGNKIRKVVSKTSSPPRSNTGSPLSYSRATSPPSNCTSPLSSSNNDCSKDCTKYKDPSNLDERQQKKKMLIESFIHQMDGESEVSINFINKKKYNVITSNPNHTKVTVNIDSERELYNLMFRKNSSNFGNLTVKKTLKQNGSPDSKQKKSKPIHNSSRPKMMASNNRNDKVNVTQSTKEAGSEYQDQLLHCMGDDKIAKPQSKNERTRGVSVCFSKFDVKEKSSPRRTSPQYILRHQSIPVTMASKKNQETDHSEQDDRLYPDHYKESKRRSTVYSTIGDDRLPQRMSFQSNNNSNVYVKINSAESAPKYRRASKGEEDTHISDGQARRMSFPRNATEDRRSTFDSAVGGAVDLPKRISTVEDEIRMLSANDVPYGEALETLAITNAEELRDGVNGHIKKSMLSLLNVTDSLIVHGQGGVSSRRGSAFNDNYTVSKVVAPETLDLKLKHEQRLPNEQDKQIQYQGSRGNSIRSTDI